MTAREAISWMDEKKHNVYSREDKLSWLYRLEVTAARFLGGYADAGEIPLASGPEEMDLDAPLLIEAPFDDLYLYQLEAQMDYAAQEYTKFNNAAAMFQAQWDAFTSHYNRNHIHKTTPMTY